MFYFYQPKNIKIMAIYKIIVNVNDESDALLIRVEDVYHTAYLSNDDDGTWVYDKDHNEVSPTLGDRGIPEGTRIVTEDENGEIEVDGRRFREITDEVYFDCPTIDIQHGINTEQIVFDSEFAQYYTVLDIVFIEKLDTIPQDYPNQPFVQKLMAKTDDGSNYLVTETHPFFVDEAYPKVTFKKL